jgi:outer membrane lipoprotein SlyB
MMPLIPIKWHMYMNKLLILFAIGASAFITGCAQNVSPNTYTGSEVGVVSKVKKGVILSRREVTIDNNSGAGGLAGAAAGAAGGSTLGNGVSTNVAGAVGGAVVGGLVGHAIDKGVNQHKGYEYIIKLEGGQTVSVVQTNQLKFKPHQRVLVIYGAMTRIVPDDENSKS